MIKFGRNVLLIAVERGRTEIVKILLNDLRFTEINAQDEVRYLFTCNYFYVIINWMVLLLLGR